MGVTPIQPPGWPRASGYADGVVERGDGAQVEIEATAVIPDDAEVAAMGGARAISRHRAARRDPV